MRHEKELLGIVWSYDQDDGSLGNRFEAPTLLRIDDIRAESITDRFEAETALIESINETENDDWWEITNDAVERMTDAELLAKINESTDALERIEAYLLSGV